MGVGREAPFSVFVNDACEVLYFHLCESISHGGRPRPGSFWDLCTPSMGKLGSRTRACLIALLRIPSMVVSCLSLNTPRCVAWYLDFRIYSIVF